MTPETAPHPDSDRRARSFIPPVGSDAAALGGAAAVVRGGRDVLDRADLQAGGLERADRGLAARARALDEDVDLAHAVLLSAAGGGLGGHLGGEGGGLTRPLEADLTGGGPGDDGPDRVGDPDDGVVERALDLGVPVSDVLLLLAARLARSGGLAGLGGHLGYFLAAVRSRKERGLLLAGLLLAGNGALRTLTGTRVGLRTLTTHRKATAVPQTLVAPDLD